MIICDVDLFLVPAPPHWICRHSLLVRLGSSDGLEGWGEAGVDGSPLLLPSRRLALLSALAGRSAFDVEDLARLDVLEDAALRSAVDMACWDLVGRRAGQPLCRLWGGLFRPHVLLAARIAADTPGLMALQARELAERGWRVQRVASLDNAEADRQALAAVREATHDRVMFQFDGQNAYTFDLAWELCRDWEEADLQFILHPLRGAQLSDLAALARNTSVPVAASCRSPAEVLAVSRTGSVPHVEIVLEEVGGLLAARRSAAVAEAAGLSTTVAARGGLGIAAAAVAQLSASTPSLGGAHVCLAPLASPDWLRDPHAVVDGVLTVPLTPGLGVEPDRMRLEAA